MTLAVDTQRPNWTMRCCEPATRLAISYDNGRRRKDANTWARDHDSKMTGLTLSRWIEHGCLILGRIRARTIRSTAVSPTHHTHQNRHANRQEPLEDKTMHRNTNPACQRLPEEAIRSVDRSTRMEQKQTGSGPMGPTSESASHAQFICKNQQLHTVDNATGLPMD